ncbi:hypothetical protein D9M70_394190 [compost metagenome]
MPTRRDRSLGLMPGLFLGGTRSGLGAAATALADTGLGHGLGHGLLLSALLAPHRGAEDILGELEVDLALVQVDPRHPHFHRIAQAEAAAAALAGQAMVDGVEVVVVAR